MRDRDLCTLACQARFPTLDLSNAVEKLVSIKCPADKPLKCLPAGICHGFDEYCHAGQNKSCFDGGMSEGELLRWCQVHNVSSMPDPSCKFACQVRFPASSNTVSSGSGPCCETAKALGGTLAGVVVLGIVGLVLYICVWRRRPHGPGGKIAAGNRGTNKPTAAAEPLMPEQTPGVEDSGIAGTRRLIRAMSDETGNGLAENLHRREENVTNQQMDAVDITIAADP
ncbi:uncharacterized protein LOC131958408 [Physella acuta]|uniref:uncharacterized protein LOC131958408 n=1 Tax=Physella acuta TaxID=109671 RepID=UPI0027DB56AD|nr:uncharacterized protein LOC131958408 [Physella acuta]